MLRIYVLSVTVLRRCCFRLTFDTVISNVRLIIIIIILISRMIISHCYISNRDNLELLTANACHDLKGIFCCLGFSIIYIEFFH